MNKSINIINKHWFNYVNKNRLFLQYLRDDSNVGIIKSIIDGFLIIQNTLFSLKEGWLKYYKKVEK